MKYEVPQPTTAMRSPAAGSRWASPSAMPAATCQQSGWLASS
ncbi:hypothetical protein GA0115255_108133 [Streptomyces sp. Ncost-T6T-2b]|nr:hypothetical protein GA0115255_108133 [Streptomyces sp. Ncost-T6T-2b]